MIFQNDSTLREVLQEIMPEMFFLFPDVDDEGKPVESLEHFNGECHTSLHYGQSDFLFFEWNLSLLKDMAANFLGADPEEVTDDQIRSMALEATNVIGGRYLVIADPEKTRPMSLPRLMNKADLEKYRAGIAVWQVGFVSGRHEVRVSAHHLK